MPHFALLDADARVVNIVALARKEDFTTVIHLGHGHEEDAACGLPAHEIGDAPHRKDPRYGEPVLTSQSTRHMEAHGATKIVDATKDTRIGMLFDGAAFAWPPEPAPKPAREPDLDLSIPSAIPVSEP